MTIYHQQVKRDVGGKTLTVMIQVGADSLIADAAMRVLERSRQWLQRADAIVSAPGELPANVLALAQTYFLTPIGGIPAADRDTMKTVIGKTNAGVAGDVWLKTNDPIKRSTVAENVLGRVMPKPGTEAEFRAKAKEKNKEVSPYHTFSDLNDPTYYGGRERRWGAIHMKSGILGSEEGVITFVHEATHKYAGTYDYAYRTENRAKKWDVWAQDSDNFDRTERAIWNADSYAFFIRDLNRL